MAFEQRLREVISSAGCTIDQFARELDETQQRVKDILRTKQKPPSDFLVKIHLIYGIDLNWLLVGDARAKSTGRELPVLLQPDERVLVEHYRAASDAGKKVIEGAAALAARGSLETTSINQSNKGERAVLVGTVGGSVKIRGRK